ncbi:MAG: amidohydrolase [Woeseiaceae bacterium]
MFRIMTVALALIGLFSASARADEALYKAIDDDYSYLHDLYLYLHQHPELSFQEKNTSARIASELRPLGFDVTEHVGGYGIVAVMKNGDGPTVLIRTDLDALPVKEQTGLPYASTVAGVNQMGEKVSVMHACGHDIHMTTFVGTARELARLKDQWSGTVVMIGQPAEERGAGAKAMIGDGLFTRFPKPDFNIAFHDAANLPAGTIGYTKGYALANVDSVDIEVHGIGGHGAYPQATKDPVVLAAQIVLALQTIVSREISPLDPAVVTVGSIHGGTKHNIIGDSVHMQLTVRTYSDEVRNKVLDSIKRIAVNEGRVAGLPDDLLPEVSVSEEEHTPSMYNDPALADRVIGAMKAAKVSDSIIETPPVMGGEDFSQYERTGDHIPGFIFWVGAVDPEKYKEAMANGETLPSLHSPFFAPKPKPTIETAVRAMTTAALELLGKKQ